ncbi:MAG TPA: uridine kinase [Longimicrobiales bacterium]|nr:uridine kinase [Longimicrobiales bacterium]
MSDRPTIIGVAGGSGSGKTTVVREIVRALGPANVAVIHHDSYYRDEPQTLAPDGSINFDHPDALETELLARHLEQLARGEAVDVPVYDFKTHHRLERTDRVQSARVIIVDGLLIFVERELRELMDIKVFVDADADQRLIRRLRRDINERGRDLDSVLEQYRATVRPMHLEFVEPSKRWADIIIPRGGHNRVALDMLVTKVRSVAGAT